MRLAVTLALFLGLSACTTETSEHSSVQTIPATGTQVRISGRYEAGDTGEVTFGYPSVNLNLHTSGGKLTMRAASTSEQSYLGVTVDGGPSRRILLTTELRDYVLSDDHQPHHIRVSHLSETWHGLVTVTDFSLRGGEFLTPPAAAAHKLLVIGDSVTCGEAIDRKNQCSKDTSWWNPDVSWGMLIGEALNAETQLVCYGGRGLTRSWNGNTHDLQAPAFIDLALAINQGPAWDHSAYQPGLILVSLGTNDFSLGIGPLPEQEPFVVTYTAFVERLLALYPKAQIALTEGAIVNDEADPARPQKTVLQTYIQATLARVGSTRVHQLPATHYPGDSCDAHPTGPQHRAMADDAIPVLKAITGW